MSETPRQELLAGASLCILGVALDALDSAVIAELIRREVEGMIDAEAWNMARDKGAGNRAYLEATSGNWVSVENFLEGGR